MNKIETGHHAAQRPARSFFHFSLLFAIVALALLLCLPAGCGTGSSPVGTNTVVSGEAPASSAVTSTAPPDLVFAVCGDNRSEGIESGVLGRIMASARDNGAAFIVDTGDVTTGGSRGELQIYKDFMNASGLPYHTVPGNHDVGRGGVSPAYAEVIGPYYYSFNAGASHFIILDNADNSTGIDATQMQWYDADLAAGSASANTFIFAHIPVADPDLPSGHTTGEGRTAGLVSGQRLVTDAATYPNVRGLFFGHIHAYLAYHPGGLPAYITGGAGAPLYFPEGAGGYFHYLLVTVRGTQVDVAVIRV
ncbi:MAG: metallophosphoesterase family protein [Thermoleophilia bacterium]